jgi:cobalt-zinc-cadmium efflux system membrane fusion protein
MRQLWIVVALATVALGGAGSGCSPDAAEDTQQAESKSTAFCEEHQIAEARCPFCNPALLESMGHCGGHGVPEAICYQCSPELIPAFKAIGDWCAGHDRPESQCYICNPELDPTLKEGGTSDHSEAPVPAGISLERTASTAPATAPPAEDLPRRERPPSVTCSTPSLFVRFDNPEIAREAGLEYAEVESRPITQTFECNAVIAYDGNRYAKLSSQVPGVVAAVHKDLGERVAPGEALVTVNSASLGAAKASYLRAQAAVRMWERSHARETDLLERGVSTERDVLEAETRLAESRAALSSAEHELLSLGLAPRQLDEVVAGGDTGTRYVLTAPFAGVVVERSAVTGEVVDRSQRLCAVADASEVWALLDIHESDARHVRSGQPVVLRVSGLPGEAFGGHITWVSSEVNPRTRTLAARAQLDNDRGMLRANMFAKAIVAVRDRHPALAVPAAAVQWEGCCNVVFVRKSATLHEPRQVHLGVSTGTVYEVLDGVEEGEVIVTQGSFLLKTEILKGSIGAGCCEVQPGA